MTLPNFKFEDVRQVQKALKKVGIDIKPDNFFGKDMDKAMKRFQQ